MTTATPYKTAVHRLSTGRMLSAAGGEVAFVALMALVFGRTHSAIWGSAALLAVVGTYGLAAPFAGMLGDRFDRRIVMIWSDGAGAVVNVVLVFVHAPTALIALSALAAVAQSPYLSASTAAIPNLVPDDELAWANATRQRLSNIGFMLGPVAGGVLVATVGGSYAFAFNAVALAASALLAWSVTGSFNEKTGEKLRGGLGAGFQFLWNDRVLRWISGAWVLILAGVGALLVSEFPLAELFHSGSLGYGLLISSWGAGTRARLAVRRARGAALHVLVARRGHARPVGDARQRGDRAVPLDRVRDAADRRLLRHVRERRRGDGAPAAHARRAAQPRLRGRRGDRRRRDVGLDRRRGAADRGGRPARGLRRDGCPRPARSGHDLVGRLGAAHAAAGGPGSRRRRGRRAR